MKATETEGALVRRAAGGDAGAFARLIERYRSAVIAVAAHHLRNDREAAQDVTQEAFIHAYRRLSTLREPERFGAWLRRIVVNLCADYRRGVLDSGAVPLREDLPAFMSSSSERLIAEWRVRAALAVLSPKTRLTVLLFHLGGYSHAEIAAFLEIPINTVRSRLRLARQRLREEILTMMDEERAENRPDPEWTRRTVEEAMRRGHNAMKVPGPERAAAWRHYDAALETLKRSEPLSDEELSLKQEALLFAGSAHRASKDRAASRAYWQEALRLAEQRGDRHAQAQALELMAAVQADASFVGPLSEEAHDLYRKAVEIYRETGDVNRQGGTLLWLAQEHLNRGEFAIGEACLREAIVVSETAQKWWLACAAHGHLDLLHVVGWERYAALHVRHTACHTVRFEEGRAYFHADYGGTLTRWNDEASPEIRARLGTLGGLEAFARTGILLDGVMPGHTWTGWHKPANLPLIATVTIRGDQKRVETPAGIFTGCLWLEQVTTRTGPVPESLERTVRDLCGIRQAFLAPGVGLVRLETDSENASGVVHWLTAYHVAPLSNREGQARYLPLSVGNTWTYQPATLPEGFTAKEFYHVHGLDHRDCWCLERYAFAGPIPSSSGTL
jgi:RNA polymerase sigma-70 factor (ECF subfamily)